MTNAAHVMQDLGISSGRRLPIGPSRWIFHVGRLLLGSIFVFSSFPKFLLPGLFVQSLHDTGIGSLVPVEFLLYALPSTELLIGVTLLLGNVFTGGALVWSVFMLAAFTCFQAYLTLWGVDAACGCFDPTRQEPSGWLGFFRTATLLCVSLLTLTFWLLTPHTRTTTAL